VREREREREGEIERERERAQERENACVICHCSFALHSPVSGGGEGHKSFRARVEDLQEHPRQNGLLGAGFTADQKRIVREMCVEDAA
jgi:hypothetical protein